MRKRSYYARKTSFHRSVKRSLSRLVPKRVRIGFVVPPVEIVGEWQ
jgi:hypothetical protein